MWPRLYAQDHEAASLLNYYSTEGCPVDCGKPWTKEVIEAAIRHGPHQSARSHDARAALREETLRKIEQGFAIKVRYGDIKNAIPEQLKISPVAAIPHKSKSYRVILDLSFNLMMNNMFLKSVNETTKKMAPQETMVQLGLTLKRLIATMADNYDLSKPFQFCKLDIKDGFWRIVVSFKDAWNFCYVLPSEDGTFTNIDEAKIVVLHALQMGWCESPPFFCAASKTARDVIDNLVNNPIIMPEHKFESRLRSDGPIIESIP